MKTPQILTGQQALDQYGLNALIECRVAVTTELNGLGHSVMQIGVIADPDSCQIDEDDTGVLWVEYQGADDWYLYSIPADEQFVLLDDKNQPVNGDQPKTPAEIYLVPDTEHGLVWSHDPAPGEGMKAEEAVKYVRADLAQSNEMLARNLVAVTSERDQAKYKLAGVLDEISDFCASLDGALLANQSADDLIKDINRRLSEYHITNADYVLGEHVNPVPLALPINLKVAKAISQELFYQGVKWGEQHIRNQSVEGHLLIMRKELQEAEDGWMKNSTGRNSVQNEIVQVVAVGIQALINLDKAGLL